MSRCFPFPPPGYEKRARVYNTDLLTKEKHKEKKHKKDKKDKEKREGKERRDKDRSKEKHREKKDRKEKHKDKEERKEKHGDKDGDRDKGKTQNSDEKTVAHQPGLYNGKMLSSNSLQNNEIMEYKFVQELARRIGDEDRASGSQMVRTVMDQRRDELLGTSMGSFSGSQFGGRQRVTDKNEGPKKLNGQGSHVGARSMEMSYDRNFSVDGRERVEGITKTVEKDAEKQMEGKPKSKHKESEKQKSRGEEKKRKSKDKDRDKGKKKEEKAKKITEQSKEQPKLKESGSELEGSSKDDPLDFRNTNRTNRLKLSSVSFSGEGNLGKRKELEINGFLTEKGNRPNKISRPLSSSHPVPENGRKLELGQNAVQIGFEKQAEANNHRMDMNEHKTNGSIMSIPPNTTSTRPLPANTVVKENGEASLKPPHPDIKYLSRVLSVPNLVELPDIVDDQEWLFGSNESQSKASNVTSRGNDETRQVWAEAVKIDSADVSALPFVIPF